MKILLSSSSLKHSIEKGGGNKKKRIEEKDELTIDETLGAENLHSVARVVDCVRDFKSNYQKVKLLPPSGKEISF